MALEERPMEKMILYGEKSLSNAELLAILLRTGTKKRNAIELANYIINKDLQGIRNLQDLTIEELCEIDGIGKSKASQIKAALELGIRISSAKPNKYKVKNPWDIYKYYMESLRYEQKDGNHNSLYRNCTNWWSCCIFCDYKLSSTTSRQCRFQHERR